MLEPASRLLDRRSLWPALKVHTVRWHQGVLVRGPHHLSGGTPWTPPAPGTEHGAPIVSGASGCGCTPARAVEVFRSIWYYTVGQILVRAHSVRFGGSTTSAPSPASPPSATSTHPKVPHLAAIGDEWPPWPGGTATSRACVRSWPGCWHSPRLRTLEPIGRLPLRAHGRADAIRSRLAARGLKAITVDTAGRLQGGELDVTLVWLSLSGRQDAAALRRKIGACTSCVPATASPAPWWPARASRTCWAGCESSSHGAVGAGVTPGVR